MRGRKRALFWGGRNAFLFRLSFLTGKGWGAVYL